MLAAEEEKRALLLRSIEEQGNLVAQSLKLLLDAVGGGEPMVDVQRMQAAIERLWSRARAPSSRLKLFLAPSLARGDTPLYFVGAVPPVAEEHMARELTELTQGGVLGVLRQTCESETPRALRYVVPGDTRETLSSVTPLKSQAGCWIVLSSRSDAEAIERRLGRPYWKAPEIRMAIVGYVVVAGVALWILFGLVRNLRRFSAAARSIRSGVASVPSFARVNRIPELGGVAEGFDRMVDSLTMAAEAGRFAAEENAHAFKTPIAVIRHALLPLSRSLPPANQAGQRSIEMIEKAVARLDALVTAARRMDEALANIIHPPRWRLSLTEFARAKVAQRAESIAGARLRLDVDAEDDFIIHGNDELLDNVLDNIIDNAASFSPPGGGIFVSLRSRDEGVRLTIEDEGPGVRPENLERIFERYFSYRPAEMIGNGGASESEEAAANFGIGLWLVRRNVEALGGQVWAENRPTGGLRMIATFPLA